MEHKNIKLWAIAKDRAEYVRFGRLMGLDNNAKNVLNDKQISEALFENGVTRLADKGELLIIHDGSDIRKEHASKLGDLGKVRSLDGSIINGYSSFNSVAVDLAGRDLTLLSTEIYSNKSDEFISQKDLKLIAKPLSKKASEEQKLHYQAIKAKVTTTEFVNSAIIGKQQIKKVSDGLKQNNPNKKLTHVIDRGSDDDATFKFINDELGDKFVIRLKSSRVAEKLEPKSKIEKLVDTEFLHKHIKHYAKIQIKSKVYEGASVVVEWGQRLNSFAVIRVQVLTRDGTAVFRAPMLLITNKEVENAEQALNIYHIYLKRAKIEGVFKFLKDALGWEESQIQDFVSMKTLLTFCYFVAGYFYEIESALIQNEFIQFIAELGGGKGKVTRTYILRGLAKMVTKSSVDQAIIKHGITPEQLRQIMQFVMRGY